MSIDYTKPVKVDGRTGFVATGVERVHVVRGPVREFLGMITPAAVAMIVVAALVLLTGCGPDKGKTPEPAPMAAPTAPVASAKPVKAKHNHLNDCKVFPVKYRPLCLKVYRQHAYGLYIRGEMGGMWSSPAGPVIVHDITHQGLTKGEMIDYLKGEALNYRDAVTHVSVNMDKLKAECGYDGQYVIKFLDEDGRPGGLKLTQIVTDCA